jgi:hypothetical protein
MPLLKKTGTFYSLIFLRTDPKPRANAPSPRFVIISTRPRWRYRLGVRTEDSQSSNPGSIPGSATNLFLWPCISSNSKKIILVELVR